MAQSRFWRRALVAIAGCLLTGCAMLAPLPRKSSLTDRLTALPQSGLPVEGQVTIYWDDHQIPFIEAEHDGDAAFALGLVHAHLRLGQMEIYRRIAQGRLAEMGGPFASDIDRGIRTIGFGRAVPEIEAMLPPQTRLWLERYVEGVNHYQARVENLPAEYRILGLEREPWTIADVLTFGRLASTDVNWLVWFSMLKLRQREDWATIWARLVANGSGSMASFGGSGDTSDLGALLRGLSKSGSNSLAIAPGRTAHGAAIMANDPHLGISAPNIWLIAGLKSPSYHAIGLMVPGLPVFAIGRNPWIAWGGTNMRAASSDLVDLSGLGPEDLSVRTESIAVRWWSDTDVRLRDSPWGPVLSDAPQLEGEGAPFSLLWMGHRASDEVTAMLEVARARNFEEFRAAFQGFALPAQNMLYADAEGNIGQVMAARLPRRGPGVPRDMVLSRAEVTDAWRDTVGTDDLPFSLNPDAGYLASANNAPTRAEVPIGYFFSPNDRVERMARLVEDEAPLTIEDVARLQRDVYMSSSVELRDIFLAELGRSGLDASLAAREREAVDAMAAWDGRYEPDAKGPVAFELFRAGFTSAFYEHVLGASDWAAFANFSRIKQVMREDIAHAPADRLESALRAGLSAAADGIGSYDDWGALHRLALNHPLGMLPGIGERYRFADFPVGGSTDTLYKTSHGLVEDRHRTSYGSTARHISDLADPDRNYFVLLGGQDGWFNSSTFLDQVPLWRSGEYLQVPLRLETVRRTFKNRAVLRPVAD